MHAPFYSDDNPRQVFYKDGFIQFSFKDGPVFRKLHEVLRDIYSGNVKGGFTIENRKGDGLAADLRPDPLDYDPAFTDILDEQNIYQKLETVTGRKLALAKLKLRINYPGPVGYGTWHRDTDFYPGRIKGNVPPFINLHYYPHFGEAPEPTLRVWGGSYRKQTDRWLIDRLIVQFGKSTPVETSDSSYTVLDTASLHQVTPTTYQKGALRLMYNFCESFQLDNFE